VTQRAPSLWETPGTNKAIERFVHVFYHAIASARPVRVDVLTEKLMKPTDGNKGMDRPQPSLRELLLLSLCSAILFAGAIVLLRKYSEAVSNFGESPAYTEIASAIRRWDFRGLQIKQFWGYPYAMALVSTITRVSDHAALLIVSGVSALLSIGLAYRLWGGWAAALFAVLSFDWMQRSFLGGSEPLAVALIFGAFLAIRRERYLLASFLAALSTVVRPLGVFSLVAIGILLLYRREYKKLAVAIVIGAGIGALYMLPLAVHFGDALATVHSYEGGKYSLFGIPLYAIIKRTILYPAPWTNLALDFGWIALVVAGAFVMALDPRFRDFARQNPVEVMFAGMYLVAVFCYNYPVFARSNFARFSIPALPIVYVALSRWLPQDRWLLWGLGVVSPILAAASALGIRNVAHTLLH
jgi:hypothetical protein